MSTDTTNESSRESILELVDLPQGVTLVSPINREMLEVSVIQGPGTGILFDGDEYWPVVEGIPYLRVGKDDVRHEVIGHLRAGSCRAALGYLLRDQDDFAPEPPPTWKRVNEIITGVMTKTSSLRTTMDMLEYGPVTHYFAHRWSAPTFLSGLGLLAQHWIDPDVVIEVACGIGQFLRELHYHDVSTIGVDVVFSKLWLAKQFVCPGAIFVCADVTRGAIPIEVIEAIKPTVFCHDAFYFFPNKEHVAAEFSRLSQDVGNILVGHAHNVEIEHGVSGSPLCPEGYWDLFSSARLYDDNDYVSVYLEETEALSQNAEGLTGCEAVSLVTTGTGGSRLNPNLIRPQSNAPLKLNPLLQVDQSGHLVPNWPMPRFAQEYSSATYLYGEICPSTLLLQAASIAEVRSEDLQEVERLARRRILLSLPERW